ncbi:MAG: FeoA family protein [Tissierellia bacterium]|nr:FeoA family protein [Tissierellia bacterium]
MRTLKDIHIGDRAKVKKIIGTGATIRRLMDMGITKNTPIYVRKVAPLGDPIQVSLRGYELTLRKEDAENIIMED